VGVGTVIVVTFDVDFTDYAAGTPFDELETGFPIIRAELARLPQLRTTWFIRVDAHIGALYGSPDHILRKHAQAIDWLRQSGHEIGWHHHAYALARSGAWHPDTDEARVCEQLRRSSEFAWGHDLVATRMGWGFHTNGTMAELERLGWAADSSAVPRPSYPWDSTSRDWSLTPQGPYYPSCADYRVPGFPERRILQVPMTTVPLASPTDNRPDVLRNIDPAYRPNVFRAALRHVRNDDVTVLVCHPYAVLPTTVAHPLLAFDPSAFRANLEALATRYERFWTMSEIIALHPVGLRARS
jgi:hypothetical protein